MNRKEGIRKNITTIDELKRHIDLARDEEKKLREVISIHPMSISRYYMSLIDRDDPGDPIRKMAVPSAKELDLSGSYDTSGEKENTKIAGLQHKYPKTVLLLSTNICSMYCRHCFRKRLVGLSNDEIMSRFNVAVDYIKAHQEVNNVLISGGDPLTLPTAILAHFLERLAGISHLDYIRIGSRIVVTNPDRILQDAELLEILKKYSLKERRISLVTQFNHPREITEKTKDCIDKIHQAGVTVNNQTVLLKGVNDSPAILAELLNGLVRIGVIPYYVFQCRPVRGVKNNFQVPLVTGYQVIEQAKKQLNGLSKRFRYIMSHPSGKIEIIGIMGDEIYLKYHQAKDPANLGKFFKKKLNDSARWLDELADRESGGKSNLAIVKRHPLAIMPVSNLWRLPRDGRPE